MVQKIIIQPLTFFIFITLSLNSGILRAEATPESVIADKKALEDTSYSKATRGFSIHVGPAIPVGGAYPDHGVHGAIGIGYAVGLRPAFIEARYDAIFSLDTGENKTQFYNAFTLGYNHYIWNIDSTTSLFAGANLGFGGGSSPKGNGGGFHTGADLGVILFRGSDVNFDLRLRLGMATAKNGFGTYPAYTGFLAGIRF